MPSHNTSPIRLCVLNGDGISPEITAATLGVLRAAAGIWQIEFAFDEMQVGLAALAAQGTTFPESAFEAAKAADGIILGPVSHNDYPPVDQGGINPSGALRKRLDLFANIRPAKTRAQFPARFGKPADLVIVRENTEGFYADRNMFLGVGDILVTPDVAISMRKITRHGSTRIVEEAFRLAMRRRRHVIAVHKANVLRVSDGLFLECARAVAARYPQVKYEERIIDAMAALLVRDASQFDVIVTTNMFGDILSDEASEIAGSLGPGRVDQCRRRPRDGAGAARLGARHRRAGQGQSVFADRLRRDAARLARRAARRRAPCAGCRGHRARARCRDRQTGMAHRRSWRVTRHQGIWPTSCSASEGLIEGNSYPSIHRRRA